MKLSPAIIFFMPAVIIFLAACRKEEPVVNIYESCCGIEPVQFSFEEDTVHAYVPNVFTPDGDGINDDFSPYFSSQAIYINYIVIKKADDNNPLLLYQVQNVERLDWYSYRWVGEDQNGIKHKGAFTYEISFTSISGNTYLISGKGCSVFCEEDDLDLNMEDCFFPTQNDDGQLNINVPTGEHTDCFN